MPKKSDPIPAPPESYVRSQKITVSLFPADNEKVTAVQIALGKRGRRVSASHITRLALRLLPVTKAGELADETAERCLALLDEMKEEDGRAMRHRG
jgi:Arc/MetJ-type ribon-helix-helix transcriptional regulator